MGRRVFWIAPVCLVPLAFAWTFAVEPKKPTPQRTTEITQGSPDESAKYAVRVARELGFANDQPPNTLDELLRLAGYEGLTAGDLERLTPDELMDVAQLTKLVGDPLQADDVLSVRFFAPKTTDISGLENPQKYSWRKLVRLRVRKGSHLAAQGIGTMVVLNNVLADDLERSPFANDPKHVQVILVRTAPQPDEAALYWLVYGAASKGAAITWSAETTWDAVDPEFTKGHAPNAVYHVPHSCMDCHQSEQNRGILTMLDVDYWIDRSLDDFPAVGAGKWPVLFDGGKNSSSAAYRRAFAAVRKFNLEVLQQNRAVDPTSFQTRAVESWVAAHAVDSRRLSPFERAVVGADGVKWDESKAVERELLPLLSQYCYRCHSSYLYNVFDKSYVLTNADWLKSRIDADEMPRDRHLPPKVKQRLSELLAALAKGE